MVDALLYDSCMIVCISLNFKGCKEYLFSVDKKMMNLNMESLICLQNTSKF